MRRLVLLVVLALAMPLRSNAHADVGFGFFIGEPTGLDLKLGLSRRSALDLLFGFYNHYDHFFDDHFNDGAYFHATYLVQPFVGRGRSILVPLRFGIGGAVFDDAGHFDEHHHIAVRAPFEVAIVFRRSPIEIYFEVALKATLNRGDNDHHRRLDLDGGVGMRFYF